MLTFLTQIMNQLSASSSKASKRGRFLIASALRPNPATQITRQCFISVTVAADCFGVSRSTLSRWLKHEPEELLRFAYQFEQVGGIDANTLAAAVRMRRLEIDGAEC